MSIAREVAKGVEFFEVRSDIGSQFWQSPISSKYRKMLENIFHLKFG